MLRALAHPLRLQLLELLKDDGPATASGLGRRVGENSGTTSWHLRQLADAGLVVEDTGRGNRRERWWRAAHEHLRMRSKDFVDDPGLAGPLQGYLRATGASGGPRTTPSSSTGPPSRAISNRGHPTSARGR
jgi:DNA-binding transcriptional ArsR family regulator